MLRNNSGTELKLFKLFHHKFTQSLDKMQIYKEYVQEDNGHGINTDSSHRESGTEEEDKEIRHCSAKVSGHACSNKKQE